MTARAATKCWEDVGVGDVLPAVVMPVTILLCVHDASATRDFFPGHHDRDYAQGQNARDVYLNTMFFHGLVDRVGNDWAGPDAWLLKRRLSMAAPVCVGDTIRTEASVTRRYEDGPRALVELDVRVNTERGLGARAVLTYILPREGGPLPQTLVGR